MLIFNEGVPGSGKTYDAVAVHLLGALKAGRKVFARINGLQPDKIAAHLNVSLADIHSLLHELTDADIPNLASIVERDSLVLIDEAHTYYVSGRVPLDPAVEQFFAEHRHQGLDIILMSQWYKRLHTAVRARVERKYVFQKLSAIGLKGRYTVRQMASISPDKFEQVDIQTRKYDDKIFPLYQSVQPGTGNIETYSVGASTAWRKLALWAAIMIPLGIFSLIYVMRFFAGDVELVKQKTTPGVSTGKTEQGSPMDRIKEPMSVLPQSKPKGPDTTGMPPQVAYVFDLASRARPRLSGVMLNAEQRPAGIIEFRDAQGPILDRLTFTQLRAMGVNVTLYSYGVVLAHGKESIVATNWPLYTLAQQSGQPGIAAPETMPSVSEPSAPVSKPATTTQAHAWPDRPFGVYAPPGAVAPAATTVTASRLR